MQDITPASLVAFAQRWTPLGGGAEEDIRETFGLTSKRYFEHLLSMTEEVPNLTSKDRERIRQVARRRLWLLGY